MIRLLEAWPAWPGLAKHGLDSAKPIGALQGLTALHGRMNLNLASKRNLEDCDISCAECCSARILAPSVNYQPRTRQGRPGLARPARVARSDPNLLVQHISGFAYLCAVGISGLGVLDPGVRNSGFGISRGWGSGNLRCVDVEACGLLISGLLVSC